jgi:zinc resistance-associated protein
MLKPGRFKSLLAATALLAVAGGTFVYAQQGFGHRGFGDGPRAEFGHQFRHRQSAADVAAFADARIAALKAGLELTPDQAKNWPPFEQAMRDMVQLRIQRIQARAAAGDQPETMSPFDRLSRRADMMSKRGAALQKVADAGKPLYQTLNDDQKGRFVKLARLLRPHDGMRGGWRHGEDDGDGHGWRHGGHRFGQDNGSGEGEHTQL